MNTTNSDTPQQKRALRSNATARVVRRRFGRPGTRVMGAPGVYGTVVRHVPALTSLGGYLVVDWDNGHRGRVVVTGLTLADEGH